MADVVPMGGRRLTGHVKALKGIPSHPLGELFIVGASLPTEETGRLAETIEFLIRNKCQVYWFGWNKVCANVLCEKGAVAQCPTDRLGSLCATVTSTLELENTEDLTGLLKGESGHDALQSALLLESAAFSYSRTRNTGAYADVVRFLAEGPDNAHLPPALDLLRRRYRESRALGPSGPSTPLAEVRALADKAAAIRDCCVLVTGEEGTAKEAVAARVHRKSARNTSPLIRFTCAGSSEDETYMRLFGQDGSTSRTSGPKQGDLALADGGTLFLEGVEQLPLKVQGCLLDIIETGRLPSHSRRREPRSSAQATSGARRVGNGCADCYPSRNHSRFPEDNHLPSRPGRPRTIRRQRHTSSEGAGRLPDHRSQVSRAGNSRLSIRPIDRLSTKPTRL